MKTRNIFFFLLMLSLTSCKQYYAAANFEEITQTHKTIAILPFEVHTSGHVPPEVTSEMIEKINENESTAFQASFHNQILQSTRKGKKALRINIQHYSKTMSILKENNISIIDSWNKSPEDMAKLLGVDAVVKGRIHKEKYFSDALSAGIDIGSAILNVFVSNRLPHVRTNNKNVKTDFAIVGSEGGNVLWSINYACQANWQQQPDQIVDLINRRASRHFPYRLD